MDIPHLLIHSSTDGRLGCFHLLATGNDAAMNMHVHELDWVPVFNSLGYKDEVLMG